MTGLLELELFGLSGGPLAAVAFITLCVLLLVYGAVSSARRRQGLGQLMTRRGFQPIEKLNPADLVTDELFYPNGFASQEMEGGYGSVLPRVPVAWSGWMGGQEVLIMEISITRPHAVKTSKSINRTVIRYVPPGDQAPPDFMIHEWVLSKGQIRGARTISGPEQIGLHYYLFSDAPDEALVPWITTSLRARLEQHRRWWIATHDGIFYLNRNTFLQRPGDMPGFLAEGEALISALLPEARQASSPDSGSGRG